MSEPIDEYNPFTKVVAVSNHGEQSCRVEWTVDNSVDLLCSDFLVRRSPDQGYTNIKLVSGSLEPDENQVTYEGDISPHYFFVDEDAYLGTRESTWYYQIIVRADGQAHYSGWVSAKGKNPKGRSIKVVDPQADNDVEFCDEVDLESESLIVSPNHAIKDQEDLFVTKQQLGITRQIMNLERVHHQRAGTRIALLKRLLEGTICADCRDTDTGQVRNSLCPLCFNTGIIGGYDTPVCTFAEDITPRNESLQPNQQGHGESDKTMYVFRYASEPEVMQHDILVQLHDDLRFTIEKVEKYMFKGKQPLISHITASLVQRNNIIYSIPADCDTRVKVAVTSNDSDSSSGSNDVESPTPTPTLTPGPTPTPTPTPTPGPA